MLFLVCFSSLIQAQTTWFTATEFSMKVAPSQIWSATTATNIDVSIDKTTKRIVIYSNTIQIIDYAGFEKLSFSSGEKYGTYATDGSYKKIYVEIYDYYSSKSAYLVIIYKDYEYKYKLTNYEQ